MCSHAKRFSNPFQSLLIQSATCHELTCDIQYARLSKTSKREMFKKDKYLWHLYIDNLGKTRFAFCLSGSTVQPSGKKHPAILFCNLCYPYPAREWGKKSARADFNLWELPCYLSAPPPPSGFLCITQKRFCVRGWNFMTFPKILWGIFWCVFCKHLLNTVAMVTTFS